MDVFFSTKQLLALFFILAAATACKQPETIVVDRTPDTVTPSDTADTPVPTQEGFQQLTIGETQPIKSLDPLMASNKSEYRAIQLVYEGLVRLNDNGDIVPALAQRWSAENNNQRYTFHLRPDVYYHDSNIFGSGTGRMVTARDIKYVFERMAYSNVPPQAAQLFMNIKGFNAYFQEQRHIYDSKSRQLSSISGIKIPNDTTVVFELTESDASFLKKLATPLAVVYPKETLNTSAQNFTAVGSGPFTFSQQSNDSTLIFAKYQDFHAASDIKLNRVDVISSADEGALWNAMESGNMHYLPDVGPLLAAKLLSKNGELKSSYSNQFTVLESGTVDFTLRRYNSSNLSESLGSDIAKLTQQNKNTLFSPLGPGIFNSSFSTDDSRIASMTNLQLEITNPENPYLKQLIQGLSKLLSEQGATLSVSDIRVPTNQTDLLFTEHGTILPISLWGESPALMRFSLRLYSVKHSKISSLDSNRYSWWIGLQNTQLPDNSN